MKKSKLSPAQVVVQEFGSLREVGRVLGLVHTSPRLWLQPKPVGSGGLIPSTHHLPLLAEAKKRGLKLTEVDLIHGR